jgi:undecaprenyl diphosphate synthase
MALLRHYLRTEIPRLVETGTRLTVIGRRDRLPNGLASDIATAEERTMSGRALHLRVALDYSAHDVVLWAVAACEPEVELTRETLGRLIQVSMMPSVATWICLSARVAKKVIRFPALGMRLCGTLLHRPDVARLQSR